MKKLARFVVYAALLYGGTTAVSMASACHTYISGGAQYEICSTLQGDCNLILPLSVYGTKSETIRRNVRNTCMQFPEWKAADCRQLYPMYRTAPNYSLAYKQYVYDTCKMIHPPASWGVRP